MIETFKHEASGAELCRKVAQPHVATFAECFPEWALWVFEPNTRSAQKFQGVQISGQAIAENLFRDAKAIMNGRKAARKHQDYSMEVGPFLSFRDYERPALSVRVAEWVLSRIAERTIIIPHDTMSFEIVEHENGWALVVARHSAILGDVWLAYIRADSIPVAKKG